MQPSLESILTNIFLISSPSRILSLIKALRGSRASVYFGGCSRWRGCNLNSRHVANCQRKRGVSTSHGCRVTCHGHCLVVAPRQRPTTHPHTRNTDSNVTYTCAKVETDLGHAWHEFFIDLWKSGLLLLPLLDKLVSVSGSRK